MTVLVIMCASERCAAQATGEELVYRFEVAGVLDPAAAKLIVHALMQERVVAHCVFVPECGCFKLSAHQALEHDALAGMLLRAGHTLSGAAHGSDGSILQPNTSPVR